jgi:hypothetical protein
MKRSAEALVGTRMVVAAAVLLLGAATPMAHAVSPVVTLRGSASLSKVQGSRVTAARFHVDTVFSTDTPGAPLLTLQRAVILFPDHAGTNGQLFASCSARQIERFRGNVKRCPRGSKIGGGTVTAQVQQLGLTATGHVAMFNSQHGKSVALNIQTLLPAYIDETIEAPITQLHGRYGEKLAIVVPHSLQEVLSGVFVGVKDFDVTISGSTRVHGVDYSYLKARTCPTSTVHGDFDFLDSTTGLGASAAVDTKIRCRAG